TTEPNPSEVDPGEVDDEASEIDPDAMGQPWMGTELEKFCETLFDTELEAEDSIAYLRTLADASVDRAQAQQFNDVADYIEGEPTHLSEAGAMDTIEEALFAGYDQCWQ